MRKLVVLLLIVSNFSLCFAGNYDSICPSTPLIEYTGRIDFSNPVAPKFSYSGISIRACFTGSSISVLLNDESNNNQFYVLLDGVCVKRLKVDSGMHTYPVATGLNDTIHEVELFRLTEQMFGKTQFCGFILSHGGKLVEIKNQRKLLIEFIGNSITCGYGNEGKVGELFIPATENHYMTYAAIVSRSFNARHLAVCKSGIGVYRNYDGPLDGSVDCMPRIYDQIFLSDKEPEYNFSEKPDLICIDLGTNDFSTNGGDSARWVSAYLNFITTVQTKNKEADIICLLGPMLSGNDLERVRKYLLGVVEIANKKGTGKVYFFEMSQQQGDLGIGTDYHPTVAQHKKNAFELAGFISNLKGWSFNVNVFKAAE
jgi:hypothetical protein